MMTIAEAIMEQDVITQGSMRTADGRALPLERTGVKGRIDGPMATVEVNQLFTNDSDKAIEAVYSFPLPHEASVYRMEFRIRDRVVKATVKEKEEARRTYERARREGRGATLLEQEKPSLFTLSVANIPPRASIEVFMEYQELLLFDDGEWRFIFPLVAPERYCELSDDQAGVFAEASKGWVAPPRLPSGERSSDVTLELEVHGAGKIEDLRCSTHAVEMKPIDERHFLVRLLASEKLANHDFVLSMKAGSAGIKPAAFFERRAGEEGTTLVVITPPGPGDAEKVGGAGDLKAMKCGNCAAPVTDMSAIREIPGFGPAVPCSYCGAILAPGTEKTSRASKPRDLVILIDRSASMRGAMADIRAAVLTILQALPAGDAFQVMAFDHECTSFDGRGSRFVAAAPEVISQVDRFLETLTARGGTELEVALKQVTELTGRPEATQTVVLITDAALGNEGRLLRRAGEILGPGRRLFVLGMGAAVDRRLIEKLARSCGGASDTLAPGEEMKPVLERFARRVREGGPLLTGLAITWEGAELMHVHPSPLPDLFGGQPIRLLGTYRGTGPQKLVITGATADGRFYRQEVVIDLPAEREGTGALGRLWAKYHVDSLLEDAGHDPRRADALKKEALSLALAHSLVTPLTSLVAEDSEVVGKGEPKRVEVSSPRPGKTEEPAPSPGMAPEGGGLARRGRTAPAKGSPEDYGMSEERIELDYFRAPAPSFSGPPAESDGMVDMCCFESAPAMDRAFGAMPCMEPPCPEMPSLDPFFTEEIRGGAPMERKVPMDWSFEGEAAVEARSFSRAEAVPPPPPAATPASRAPSPPPAPPLLMAKEAVPVKEKAAAGKQLPEWAPTFLEAKGSEDYSAEELKWLETRTSGELDLVFLVDETGSMGDYIEQVKRHLLALVSTLRRSPLLKSLRLGLVTYRDHPPQDHSYASKVTPLTDDIQAIEKAVRAMAANGGGDGPESVTDGLVDVVRLDWRPRAARAVVWFGDAPPHGVVPYDDGFPDGCPCGYHWFTQAENCREMGIAVYAVGCLPGLGNYAGGEDVFRAVAKATRATYLPLLRASLLVPLIAGAASVELDRQRLDERLADASAPYIDTLLATDQKERIRFLTDLLRSMEVRPRVMEYNPDRPAPAPLRFREIEAQDVEASLGRLHAAGRTPF